MVPSPAACKNNVGHLELYPKSLESESLEVRTAHNLFFFNFFPSFSSALINVHSKLCSQDLMISWVQEGMRINEVHAELMQSKPKPQISWLPV